MKKGIYKFLIIKKHGNGHYTIKAEIGVNGIPFYEIEKVTYIGYSKKDAIRKFRQEKGLARLHMQTIEG